MRFKRRKRSRAKSKRQLAIREQATRERQTGNIHPLNRELMDAGICYVCGEPEGTGYMCPRCVTVRKDEAALKVAADSEKCIRYNEVEGIWEVFELSPGEFFWTPVDDVLKAGNAPFVSFELTWAMPRLKDLLSLDIR